MPSLVRLGGTGDRQVSVRVAFTLKQKLNAVKQNLKVNRVLCSGAEGCWNLVLGFAGVCVCLSVYVIWVGVIVGMCECDMGGCDCGYVCVCDMGGCDCGYV